MTTSNTHVLLGSSRIKDPKFICNTEQFWKSLQQMIDRLIQGYWRYHQEEKPVLKYTQRVEGAIRKYRHTGNQEYLIDAANYCLLEIYHPTISKPTHFTSLDSKGRNWGG